MKKQIFTIKDPSGNDQRYTANEQGELIPLVEEKKSTTKTFFSPDEARAILGLSRNTFMNLLYSGQLKGIKAGRRWIISLKAIESFANPAN